MTGQIDLLIVVLMAILAANVGQGEHRPRSQCLLDASAELVTYRQFVIVGVDAGDSCRQNRQGCRGDGAAVLKVESRIGEGNVIQRRVHVARRVDGAVVHIVALNALVHGAKSTADYGFALAGQVIGESDAGAESSPVIVDQAGRNPVLAADANAVRVELHARQDRIRT